MAPPSPLVIATQAVQRLVKENDSYFKEFVQQTQRVLHLESEQAKRGSASLDDNDVFLLKQERRALEETKAMFVPLYQRIGDSIQRLEEQIAASESVGGPADEIAKAKEALKLGKDVGSPAI
ncbi:tubulin binding cofactor A [Biscogniauxia sp. FL1348]|nr:tubulin binding cofactor A [Biscogniauxia sp. FL1348]